MNRDPIEEWGGINLYAAVYNTPIGYIDALGREGVAATIALGAVKACARTFLEDVLLRALARQVRMNEALMFLIDTAQTGGFRQLRPNRWVAETDNISPIGRSGISEPSRRRWIRRCLTSFGRGRLTEAVRARYPDLPVERILDAAEEAARMLAGSNDLLTVDVRYYVFYSCIQCDETGNRGFDYIVNTQLTIDAGSGLTHSESILATPHGRHSVPQTHFRWQDFVNVVCPDE